MQIMLYHLTWGNAYKSSDIMIPTWHNQIGEHYYYGNLGWHLKTTGRVYSKMLRLLIHINKRLNESRFSTYSVWKKACLRIFLPLGS